MIETFVGSIIITAIVVVGTNILNKTEMNSRTLLLDAICVLFGAGLMTGLLYFTDRKKNDK